MHQFLKISKVIFSFYLKHKWGFFLYLFVGSIAAVLANIEPFLYKAFVDEVTTHGVSDSTFLLKIIILVAAFRLVSGILEEVTFMIFDKGFYLQTLFEVQGAVFSYIQKLSFGYHQDKKSGTLISIMNRGANGIYSYTTNIVFQLLFFMIDLIFLVFALGIIDPRVMIVILITVAVYLVSSYFLLKENIKQRNIANKADDALKAVIADNFINYETVKYFRQEKYEIQQLNSQRENWLDKQYAYTKTFRAFGIMYSVVTAVSIFVTLYISYQGLINKLITIGAFVLILTFITRLYQKLAEIFFQFREVAKNFADLEQYLGILEIPVEVSDSPSAQDVPAARGEVRFCHVSFTYKQRSYVLKDVSFTASPHETVALVGKSGAGKTTISKLLLRLYDITEGAIMIDGIDIRNIPQESLRELIGLVPQEPLLFNNTIRYNISYARPDSGMDVIEKAAEVAFLREFIAQLPSGYETEVGERGMKLSGGQKQRLAIARTIIQNPKIVVFDEATSHLDSESEYYIQTALKKIAEEKTVIMIAHRLSTIMHADKILVFENGSLVSQGKHQELITANSPLYTKLWNLQSQGKL